jgi:hypothetical protein
MPSGETPASAEGIDIKDGIIVPVIKNSVNSFFIT